MLQSFSSQIASQEVKKKNENVSEMHLRVVKPRRVIGQRRFQAKTFSGNHVKETRNFSSAVAKKKAGRGF
jgi:hypothetical protein